MTEQKEPAIHFRMIEEKDNGKIARLIRETFREFHAPLQDSVYDDPVTDNLYRFFKRDKAAYWVIEQGNDIKGGCGFYPTNGLPKNCAELVKFYFDPEIRGKGLASKLISMVEKEAARSGYTQLYIESFPQFQHAVAFYQHKGFKKLPGRLGHSGHTATTIHLIKNISQE